MNENHLIVVVHSKNKLHRVMKNILALLLGTKSKLDSRVGHELVWKCCGKTSNLYSRYFKTAIRSNSAIVWQIN